MEQIKFLILKFINQSAYLFHFKFELFVSGISRKYKKKYVYFYKRITTAEFLFCFFSIIGCLLKDKLELQILIVQQFM